MNINTRVELEPNAGPDQPALRFTRKSVVTLSNPSFDT
jgi:hypothetical protein